MDKADNHEPVESHDAEAGAAGQTPNNAAMEVEHGLQVETNPNHNRCNWMWFVPLCA